MPLNANQLKFLQEHVLRRSRAVGTEALDLATQSRLPSEDSEAKASDRALMARKYLDMLADLSTPGGANGEETLSLENLRAAIRANLGEPQTESGLAEASRLLQALDAAVRHCQQRVEAADLARRLAARLALVKEIDEALAGVDPEAMEPEKSQIPLAAAQIKSDLPSPPADKELETARTAFAELKKAILAAAQRVQEDRKRRAALKLDLLERVGKAALSKDATSGETIKADQLSTDATTLVEADPPSADALEKAEQALVLLEDFVGKINEDITSVRKVRHELAVDADAKFRKLSLTPPKEYPGGKKELNEARDALAKDLAPFLDWSRVTLWEAKDLALVSQRIEPLGVQFEAFRQDVAKAVEQIGVVSAAVAKAIAEPSGEKLSATQVSYFTKALEQLELAAKADVLAAKPHVEKMTSLLKQAASVARVRTDLLQRLKLRPAAPVAATAAEQKRWTALRAAAAQAADDVVQA